jgi:DNA polymerase
MDIITVDFETYYDKDYSLSNMQTDAYIKDQRFEIVCVCVMVNDGPAHHFTGGDVETAGWLHANFDWRNSAVRCHNTLFDGYILTQHCGIRPKLWMDTLAQARMLFPHLRSHSLASMAKHFKLQDKGAEVIQAMGKRREDFDPISLREYQNYCEHDTWLCREMGNKMDPFTPVLEMKLIDMTIRMFTEPKLYGDTAVIQQLYDAEVTRKKELLEAAEVDRSVIMSNDRFADALMARGVHPPKKTSPRTGKQTYAFAKSDKEFTDLLEHEDLDV